MLEQLNLLAPDGFPLVEEGDDIVGLIADCLRANDLVLENGDILVVAQKIISKAENRYVYLRDVEPSSEALALAAQTDKDPRQVELVLRESREVVRKRRGVIVVEHRNGYVHANAGIDRSNIVSDEDNPRLLLLPENPDVSAKSIRDSLYYKLGVKVQVIINDSAGRAWRMGTQGFAIGTAGFEPLVDKVGQRDIFGTPLQVTQIALGDELAAAASLLMGQADERRPVVVVKGAKLPQVECGSESLLRPRDQDMFR